MELSRKREGEAALGWRLPGVGPSGAAFAGKLGVGEAGRRGGFRLPALQALSCQREWEIPARDVEDCKCWKEVLQAQDAPRESPSASPGALLPATHCRVFTCLRYRRRTSDLLQLTNRSW